MSEADTEVSMDSLHSIMDSIKDLLDQWDAIRPTNLCRHCLGSSMADEFNV